MKEQEIGNGIEKKWEGKTTQSTEKQKQWCLIPEREMRHIERQMRQAAQARELTERSFRQLLRAPSETALPKIIFEGPSVQSTQRRKQVNEREQMQIKDHQERMIRGRELIEQRLRARILRKSQNQLPVAEKCERIQKEIKEFESVIAYPLFQPRRSQIKVNILMEKSQNREEEGTIINTYQRKFLTLPPFLRSQIRKIKD